jgi:Ca2+-transporting ATPase
MTGREIDAADDDELRRRLRDTSIFARVVPGQKLRLVRLLAADGEVVAMTGDGVNDAPALKAAHIGIAMGGRGSDVAREAAALVVTDDDFSSLVRSLRLGRRIFDNLRKAMMYVLAVHVPIAGLSVLPVLMGEPMLFLPIHVAFLELMVDPACALGFEAQPEEADVMRRPPRRPGAPMFDARLVTIALLQGGSVLAASLAVYLYGHRHGGDDSARAMAFSALIAGNVALILTNRTWRVDLSRWRDPVSLAVAGGALGMLTAALTLPPLRSLFHFAPLSPAQAGVAIAAGLLCTAWFEALKILRPQWLAAREPGR